MPDVGCAGILVEDTFCGPMSALPAPGSLLLLNEMSVKAGGCAANVAIDLAKQGVAVDVCGCVGADSAADVLFRAFEAQGVGSTGVVRVADVHTSKTVILLVAGEDRRYLHVAGANRAFAVSHIDRQWLSRLKIFYLGGLFALPGVDLTELAELLRFCRSHGVRTVVDVVVTQGMQGLSGLERILPLLDVFVPNEDEARVFTGFGDPFDQLRAFERAGAGTVIITRGERGSVARSGGKTWSCGTFSMDVVDPSGSGDAFSSGVIKSMLSGWDVPTTLRYASAVGASATRATGTTGSVFTAVEAGRFLTAHPLNVIQET